MATIVTGSELLSRAVAFILEEKRAHANKKISTLVDEAAMRFNLSPLESESLLRIIASADETIEKK